MQPPFHLRSGQYGCVGLVIAERKESILAPSSQGEDHHLKTDFETYDSQMRKNFAIDMNHYCLFSDVPIYAEYHHTADTSAAYDGDVRAGKFI